MRHSSIIILVTFFVFSGKSQSTDTNTCLPSYFQPFIYSTYTLCDTLPQGLFYIHIEPTFNNLWQIGKTNKLGTTSPNDTSCLIITDTLNSYSPNNFSAFSFNFPATTSGFWNFGNYYISFWHKYNTDSLLDGCWLEFSDDSGANWHQVNSLINLGYNVHFQNGHSSCNFYNIFSGSGDTISGGIQAWSGSSNGWKYVSIWLNQILPLKPNRNNQINSVRFVFKSDSVNTNKDGWSIDDINIGFISVLSGMNDFSKNNIPIYPNPSTGKFTFKLPSVTNNLFLEVYNSIGKLLFKKPIFQETNSINLEHEANGLYLIKIVSDSKLIGSQKILIDK